MTQNNSYRKSQGLSVPIWEKYMLTVDEAVQYFGIGEKKIRMLIAENLDTEFKVYPMSRTFSFLFFKNLDTEF